MREAVQRIYRERKALVASLKVLNPSFTYSSDNNISFFFQDVGSAVAKLDAVLVCVALMGIIFACLLIFNRSNTLESLVPLATIVLGFSFIFGNSAQTLFESVSIKQDTFFTMIASECTIAFIHFLYPCFRCWRFGPD